MCFHSSCTCHINSASNGFSPTSLLTNFLVILRTQFKYSQGVGPLSCSPFTDSQSNFLPTSTLARTSCLFLCVFPGRNKSPRVGPLLQSVWNTVDDQCFIKGHDPDSDTTAGVLAKAMAVWTRVMDSMRNNRMCSQVLWVVKGRVWVNDDALTTSLRTELMVVLFLAAERTRVGRI